jgi:hypothetical protein
MAPRRLGGAPAFVVKYPAVGRTLVIAGLVIAAIGAVIMLGVPLGRLPGDIAVRRGNFSFYFPLTTSIVVSIVLTLLLAWFRR